MGKTEFSSSPKNRANSVSEVRKEVYLPFTVCHPGKQEGSQKLPPIKKNGGKIMGCIHLPYFIKLYFQVVQKHFKISSHSFNMKYVHYTREEVIAQHQSKWIGQGYLLV